MKRLKRIAIAGLALAIVYTFAVGNMLILAYSHSGYFYDVAKPMLTIKVAFGALMIIRFSVTLWDVRKAQ